MAESELMPDLRLVSVERIRFHERPESRRTAKLVQRIREEALLRNPPIAAEMDNGDYLLLDGANRVSAFRDIGFTHTPVQAVHYGDKRIQLKGWHHLLLQGRSLHLFETYAKLPGVRMVQVGHEGLAELLELRQVYAVLVDEAADSWALLPVSDRKPIEIHHRIEVLQRVIGTYEGRSDLERVKLADYSLLPEVIREVQHQLVLFPTFRKEELIQLVSDSMLIPTGISRHLIPGRALEINLPLDFLTALKTPAEKVAHFMAFVERIKMAGRVRFYEESVFIMNE